MLSSDENGSRQPVEAITFTGATPSALETDGISTPLPLPEKRSLWPVGRSMRRAGVRMNLSSGRSISAYLKPALMSKKPCSAEIYEWLPGRSHV